jgi:hypothetical protein
MLEEIFRTSQYAFVDNKSEIDSVYSTKLVDDKRLRIDIAALSECVTRCEVVHGTKTIGKLPSKGRGKRFVCSGHSAERTDVGRLYILSQVTVQSLFQMNFNPFQQTFI